MRPKKDPAGGESLSAASLFNEAQAAIRDFVGGSNIGTAAAAAFGVSGADLAAVVRTLDRKGWPKLVLVDDDVLRGARGAYDEASDTIYLSRDFVAASRGAPAAVVAVLIEEIGHAIDARVNRTDSAGDEGAIFADYVLGQAPSSAELSALKAENDRTTITIGGKSVAVEVAAPVVGSVTLDGSLADWSATEQIDTSSSVSGYDIYGKFSGDSYVFALKAPVAIGAMTTAWLNTDQNASTGYKIWGFAGGAEYNVNFDASGTPRLYTGNAGQTLVSGATVSFGYSADKKIVELAVAKSAIGSPAAINTLWDVNDSTFLPTDYSATQYTVSGSAMPVRTDFAKHVGILYSDTSAAKYFDKMAYSQLFMAAQNQAAMAGVSYDVLTEADLTNLAKLVNYDAILFPSFSHVQSSQAAAIENTLKTASQQYKVGLIASGEFMTYNQTGGALSADPYARMKSLLGLNISGGGFPADVVVKAGDVAHPMMNDYAAGEVIHSYDDVGWLAFTPTGAGASVLATQTIGAQTHNAVVATTTGGRNVHFSTDEVMADNNLLWQAIDYSVNGSGVTAGLQLSRQTSIVASRVDMDQAMEMLDVNPPGGAQGIYDKLLPVLQQWKTQYNYVGSYYVDIGNNPAQDQATDWAVSGQYYKSLIAMGNELGSHSLTHPHNTNALTAAQIQSEFQGSKQIIEQQMSQILGRTFVVDGAAVPGNPENLATAQSILQYYNYLSGGFSGVGAGYHGAFGYLNPAMATGNKVYLAPNVIFDFSLVEFQGMTPTQAAAEWQREWSELTSHADVPVLVWPWHDYGAATWSVNPPTPSPYNVSMFTDFIAKAYSRGTEFVTLDDLAERISSFEKSGLRTTVSGSTITATVTSAAAGKLALDLDNLGSQKIASVTNWYAYDNDSVFLPRAGGTFTINLGASATDVTHITSLPMRAELLSLSGNGTNLSFSVIGEGRVVVDLVAPAGRQVNVTGATIVSLVGDQLTLDLGSAAQDNVSITLSSASNRAPTITSNGGGDTASITVPENTTATTTVTATDPDAGQSLSYAIVGGADQALLAINAAGVLTFKAARNREAPADADLNNSYVVQVRVTDNGNPVLSDTQTITINVADVNDNAPVITTAAAISRTENTTVVAALASTDADTVGTNPAVFSITGGVDAARFAISSGSLVFVTAPDYENPTDSDRNNSYVVQISASDGTNVTNKTITVTITDVAETTPNQAPVITSNGGGATATLSVPENGTAVTNVTATDSNAGQTLSYSIVGGADQALLRISTTGALTFASAPNFEAPADSDRNNSYIVQVRVTDNGSPALVDTQTITVNVTDVAEGTTNRPPAITSNGGGAAAAISLAENASAVTTVIATDPDAGNTLTYLMSGGVDAARFTLNAGTGALAFITPPDFEAPTDQGANNVYNVIVGARDNGGLTDTQALAITVSNVNGVTLSGDNNANTLTGTPEPDTIHGNGGNDTLNGLGGADTLYGGAGSNVLDGGPGADTYIGGPASDVFIWDPADASVAGGGGVNTLRVPGSGVTLDLTQAVSRNQLDGIGIIDLTGTGNNTAVLSINDVFTMCWDNNLRFDGNTGDRVTVLDTVEWTRGADQVIGANSYRSWTGSGALMLIDTDVATNLV